MINKQTIKEAVALRKTQKKRKPTFLRQNVGIVRVRNGWRRARGGQAKVRLKLRSYRKQPSIGYSSPRAARHRTAQGYEQHVIFSPSELKEEMRAIIVGRTVGERKRLDIIKRAQELGLIILNIKDTQAYIKEVQTMLQANKEKRAQKKKKKETLKKEVEKKEKESKEKQQQEQGEDKKKKETEEKKKVLEQK